MKIRALAGLAIIGLASLLLSGCSYLETDAVEVFATKLETNPAVSKATVQQINQGNSISILLDKEANSEAMNKALDEVCEFEKEFKGKLFTSARIGLDGFSSVELVNKDDKLDAPCFFVPEEYDTIKSVLVPLGKSNIEPEGLKINLTGQPKERVDLTVETQNADGAGIAKKYYESLLGQSNAYGFNSTGTIIVATPEEGLEAATLLVAFKQAGFIFESLYLEGQLSIHTETAEEAAYLDNFMETYGKVSFSIQFSSNEKAFTKNPTDEAANSLAVIKATGLASESLVAYDTVFLTTSTLAECEKALQEVAISYPIGDFHCSINSTVSTHLVMSVARDDSLSLLEPYKETLTALQSMPELKKIEIDPAEDYIKIWTTDESYYDKKFKNELAMLLFDIPLDGRHPSVFIDNVSISAR